MVPSGRAGSRSSCVQFAQGQAALQRPHATLWAHSATSPHPCISCPTAARCALHLLPRGRYWWPADWMIFEVFSILAPNPAADPSAAWFGAWHEPVHCAAACGFLLSCDAPDLSASALHCWAAGGAACSAHGKAESGGSSLPTSSVLHQSRELPSRQGRGI